MTIYQQHLTDSYRYVTIRLEVGKYWAKGNGRAMIKIDKKNYKPISYQIKEKLQRLILDGTFKEGEILPSVKYFEKKLGVSFKPIRKALIELRKEGLVYSRKGAGWFVSGNITKSEKPGRGEKNELNLRETITNMPLPYILTKKTITVGLLDMHTAQIEVWEKVFSEIEKDIKTITFRITGDNEKTDIRQVSYGQIRGHGEKFMDLSNFQSISKINFSDIYSVFLKGIVDKKKILGLPSRVCFPLLYFNKKFDRQFEKLIYSGKTRISWNEYINFCIKFRNITQNYEDGFILSSFSPFYYFVLNGVEPFDVKNGNLILNFEDKKVLKIFSDLKTMAENNCYLDRNIYLRMANPKEIFLKGAIPLMESFIFYSPWLKESKLNYHILPVPVNPEEDYKIPVNCSYWIIPSDCKEPSLSAEIITKMLSFDMQKIIAGNGQFPVLKSVAHSNFFKTSPDENKKAQIFLVENGENYDVKDIVFHKYLNEVFNFEMNNLINNLQGIEETVKNLLRGGGEKNGEEKQKNVLFVLHSS